MSAPSSRSKAMKQSPDEGITNAARADTDLSQVQLNYDVEDPPKDKLLSSSSHHTKRSSSRPRRQSGAQDTRRKQVVPSPYLSPAGKAKPTIQSLPQLKKSLGKTKGDGKPRRRTSSQDNPNPIGQPRRRRSLPGESMDLMERAFTTMTPMQAAYCADHQLRQHRQQVQQKKHQQQLMERLSRSERILSYRERELTNERASYRRPTARISVIGGSTMEESSEPSELSMETSMQSLEELNQAQNNKSSQHLSVSLEEERDVERPMQFQQHSKHQPPQQHYKKHPTDGYTTTPTNETTINNNNGSHVVGSLSKMRWPFANRSTTTSNSSTTFSLNTKSSSVDIRPLSDHPSTSSWRKSLMVLRILVYSITAVVAAIILGVTLNSLGLFKKDGNTNASAKIAPTALTSSLTSSFTALSNTNNNNDINSREVRLHKLQQLVLQHGLSQTHDFPSSAFVVTDLLSTTAQQQSMTPQRQALEWLTDSRALAQSQESRDIVHRHLLQRYGLAVLYLATVPGGSAHVSTASPLASMTFGHVIMQPHDASTVVPTHAHQDNALLSGWMSSTTSVCQWRGVTCSEADLVVGLHLSGTGLVGTFPSREVMMSLRDSLVTVDLSHNPGLVGSIAGSLCNSGHMESLVADCQSNPLFQCDCCDQCY